jgi:ribosomal-protein-alanine N-acetyltransferase
MVLDQLAFGPTWNKPRNAFREALSRAATFAVGTIDDQIVAYEWADTFGDHAHLTRLATHPDYQGGGIGTQLLHYSLEKLGELQVKIVTLNTQQDNLRSQELYRRFGFRNTHQEIGVYVKTLKNGSQA